MGVTKICMMAKTSRMRGKANEVWTIVPARGESLRVKQIVKEERRWDAHEYMRIKETEKVEAGHTSWAMGVMCHSDSKVQEEGEAETISSITNTSTNVGTTVSTDSQAVDISFSSLVRGIESRVNKDKEEMIALHNISMNMEREKTRADMMSLKLDLIEVMKKDNEDRREEIERRKLEEEERWEKRLKDIMGVIGVMGIKNHTDV
jgi:hypothetical protein